MPKDHTNSPILVTGAARSGTSLVAACFNLCGAWKGDTVGPSRWNRKGMFENYALRQNIVKPLLRKIGADPRGQYPLPNTKDTWIPQKFKRDVLQILKEQGWTKDKPWMYKCVKMSLIWPVWKYAFPDSKWIIVRRKTDQIVNSCIRTGFMTEFSFEDTLKKVGCKTEEQGWEWWVDQYKAKFVEIINSGADVKTIWPERMIKADYSQIMEAIKWVGLEWNGPGIMDFIEPKWWNERRK